MNYGIQGQAFPGSNCFWTDKKLAWYLFFNVFFTRNVMASLCQEIWSSLTEIFHCWSMIILCSVLFLSNYTLERPVLLL